ncbi:MAG: alpha-galactosidase [Bacillota bacterium]
MISFNKDNNMFVLESKNTTYVIGIGPKKHLYHLYYGEKLEVIKQQDDFFTLNQVPIGNATNYEDSENLTLNNVPLEFSTYGKGDYREPTIHIEDESGYRSMDFIYSDYEIIDNLHHKNMPQAKKEKTIKISLIEKTSKIKVNLLYSLFEDDDVIVRNIIIENTTDQAFVLERMLSANIDFLHADYDLMTLDGAWIRERHVHRHPLRYGVHKIDSKKGVSSSDHNPFFAILDKESGNNFGSVYGFNLIYSGNFEANIEVNPHDMLRINLGINSFDFKWQLKPGQMFITPEAVLTYSNKGLNGMRQLMHNFVKQNIIKKTPERPIKINNWEATYFDFNEKKLLAIAKKAKKLGIECFCLDDGWFGERHNDESSLGDWQENKKKLPGGLERFSHKIKKMGLKFGLWVEPEMVNMKSNLYSKHPDWAIRHPKADPSLGRHQLILDLSKTEVVDYLFDALSNLFKRANVDYVKWDMNRNFSDIYSQGRSNEYQGTLTHKYVLGLYDLLERLKNKFPNVLFESCSSGGNRYDLGMLYYMPQTWTSDNTDSYERLKIQQGTSLAYPLSSISNHVSDDVSHQVLRQTPLETRFNVACFGILGYELDLRKRKAFDYYVIKHQIEFYKKHRLLLQNGSFYDLSNQENYRFMVVDEEKNNAILGVFQGLLPPNPGHDIIRLTGLDPNKNYHIHNRVQYENIKRYGDLTKHALPVKLKTHGFIFNWLSNWYRFEVEKYSKIHNGSKLMSHGLNLPQRFAGTGVNESIRLMPDFSSRLYVIEAQN